MAKNSFVSEVTELRPATLLKLTLLHGCFSRFLKLCKWYQIAQRIKYSSECIRMVLFSWTLLIVIIEAVQIFKWYHQKILFSHICSTSDNRGRSSFQVISSCYILCYTVLRVSYSNQKIIFYYRCNSFCFKNA